MATFYYESLSPQIRQKMKEKAYSYEELRKVQESIKKRHLEKVLGFRRVLWIMGIVLASIIGMTLASASKIPNMNMTVIVLISAFTVVLCVLILIFLNFLLVDLVRNQFIMLLKKNYPEYEGQFGKDSFKQ